MLHFIGLKLPQFLFKFAFVKIFVDNILFMYKFKASKIPMYPRIFYSMNLCSYYHIPICLLEVCLALCRYLF